MPAPNLPSPQPLDAPGSFLFSDDVIQALTNEEERYGLYTGERCPVEKREAIIALLGQGHRPNEIHRWLKVDRRTVLNVADHYAVEIEDYDRKLSAKQRRAKFAILDRIERNVDSLPMQSLALTYKMIADSEAVDSGRASARVEHVHRVDLFADSGPGSFHEFMRDIEVAEVIPEKNGAGIGCGGQKNCLMPAGAAVEAELVEDPVQTDGHPPESGKGSDGSDAFTQESEQNIPTFIPADPADRRGGDPDRARAGGGATDNSSRKFLANGTSS